MRTNPLKTIHKRNKSESRQKTLVKIGSVTVQKTQAKKNREREEEIKANVAFHATLVPNPYDFL